MHFAIPYNSAAEAICEAAFPRRHGSGKEKLSLILQFGSNGYIPHCNFLPLTSQGLH